MWRKKSKGALVTSAIFSNFHFLLSKPQFTSYISETQFTLYITMTASSDTDKWPLLL